MRIELAAMGPKDKVTVAITQQAKEARAANPAAGVTISSLRDQVLATVAAADVEDVVTVKASLDVSIELQDKKAKGKTATKAE